MYKKDQRQCNYNLFKEEQMLFIMNLLSVVSSNLIELFTRVYMGWVGGFFKPNPIMSGWDISNPTQFMWVRLGWVRSVGCTYMFYDM